MIPRGDPTLSWVHPQLLEGAMERPSFPRDEQRPPGNGAGWDQGAEQIPNPSPGAGGGGGRKRGGRRKIPAASNFSGCIRRECDGRSWTYPGWAWMSCAPPGP